MRFLRVCHHISTGLYHTADLKIHPHLVATLLTRQTSESHPYGNNVALGEKFALNTCWRRYSQYVAFNRRVTVMSSDARDAPRRASFVNGRRPIELH